MKNGSVIWRYIKRRKRSNKAILPDGEVVEKIRMNKEIAM